MEKNNFTPDEKLFHQQKEGFYIQIQKDGPYLVYGQPTIEQDIIVPNAEGHSWTYRPGLRFEPAAKPCALCRCGESKKTPFCDGSHLKAGKDLTETADHDGYLEKSRWIEGEECMLSDRKDLCVFASFCGTDGLVWDLVKDANPEDKASIFLREVGDCPSGRIVAWDKKTGKPLEPELEASIGLLEDFKLKISGPLWVKGGILIKGADGQSYEVRNRVTLCRCGYSKNKPFCDGSHVEKKWSDKLPIE